MRIFRFLILFFLVIAAGCAKRGNISGGAKDTIAPVLRVSFPKNYSTGFTGNKIRLEFDEYIKLKEVNRQLVVSPPLKRTPDISPLTASKTINIRIYDTLQPNTTYSFNFGESIRDNNEEIPLPGFKFVFSTGTYIDSLTLSGNVKDAFEKKPEQSISVLLYEANEAFSDSLIYKENPRYLTTTRDSLSSFTFENLKEGKYRLVAITDLNRNNKFDPRTEKIGFQRDFVTVPSDTLYGLELFREALQFKPVKPTQASGNRLIMGYTGKLQYVSATITSGAEKFPAIVTKFPQKDSLNIWIRPNKVDSLQVQVKSRDVDERFNVRIKNQRNDTLKFSPDFTSVLPLRENFAITATRPIIRISDNFVTIRKPDSTAVAFTTTYDSLTMRIRFDFEKEPNQKYSFAALPGAFTDYLEETNDSLTYSFSTKNSSDYGNLRVKLENVRRFPVILQIVNAKNIVVASQIATSAAAIDFNALEPALYTLRVIYDDNANGEWDTGSFLQKRQSEEVIYFSREVDVRANWDVDQPFTLP